MRASAPLLAVFLLSACNQAPPTPTVSALSASPSVMGVPGGPAAQGAPATARAAAGPGGAAAPAQGDPSPSQPSTSGGVYGAPLDKSAFFATLTDIAKNPGRYHGKPVLTEGEVTRVCQERGCWMALRDHNGGGTATVRMHGHSFFVPTTSQGRHARVQGRVLLRKDGKECEDMTAVDAQLELDADGVELL